MKKDRFSRTAQQRVTPTGSMREFAGGSAFCTVMVLAALFAFLHQRVITAELAAGTGGAWCSLGAPAALCLAVSAVLTFFSSKTRLLPALVPIIGLGGIEASLIMFAVVQVKRLGSAIGTLALIQEIAMLAFLASAFLCVLMLMLTGIGLAVPAPFSIPLALTSVLALILYAVRVLYTFGLTFTAVSNNLVVSDDSMKDDIAWVLRSAQPGTEEAVAVYYARLLDCAGIMLLLLACITFATTFHGFFSEKAHMIKNNQDIPLLTHQRRVYVGYDEYTDEPARPAEESFELTRDGYYVEKKDTTRSKFKRRDRSQPIERPEIASDSEAVVSDSKPAQTDGEYYDDYIPGEGWGHFRKRLPVPGQEQAPPAEAKKVTPRQSEPPMPDPHDPDIWNRYKK